MVLRVQLRALSPATFLPPAATAGQIILVLGAGGGVGLAAVQLARCMGARVIAVARGEDKMKALQDVSVPLLLLLLPAAVPNQGSAIAHGEGFCCRNRVPTGHAVAVSLRLCCRMRLE